MSNSVDNQIERPGLGGSEGVPRDVVEDIHRLVEAAQADPTDLRPLETLNRALEDPNFFYHEHTLSAIAELTASEDDGLAEAAMDRLLAVCEEEHGHHPADAIFKLSTVLRQGSEAQSKRALEYLKPIIIDSSRRHWIDAVQALGNGGRSSRFSAIAQETVEIMELRIDLLEGPDAKHVYQALCFEASAPHPDVADRVDQIKLKYRGKGVATRTPHA